MKKNEPGYDAHFYDCTRMFYRHGMAAWRSFVLDHLKARSLADFGCGQGDWLAPFVDVIPVYGFDGYADARRLRIPRRSYYAVDFRTVTPKRLPYVDVDVTMSLETMEHVVADFENNFLDCLLHGRPRLVVLGVGSGKGTYDPKKFRVNRLGERVPGGPDWRIQWGRHHVNCQPVEVVIKKMRRRGYVVDARLSDMFSGWKITETRYAFGAFYRRNTRVYRRR